MMLLRHRRARVGSCDEFVRKNDLDESDNGADEHAEQSVQEKGRR